MSFVQFSEPPALQSQILKMPLVIIFFPDSKNIVLFGTVQLGLYDLLNSVLNLGRQNVILGKYAFLSKTVEKSWFTSCLKYASM